MSKQLEQIQNKLDYLEKLFNINQQNVNFNLALTWTILGVIIAAIGASLYFLSKTWVNNAVNKEISSIKATLTSKMLSYVSGEFYHTLTPDSLERFILMGFKPLTLNLSIKNDYNIDEYIHISSGYKNICYGKSEIINKVEIVDNGFKVFFNEKYINSSFHIYYDTFKVGNS